MKKITISILVIILVFSSAVHFSVAYLNYIRTLGIGFTQGVSLMKKDDLRDVRKNIFQVKP